MTTNPTPGRNVTGAAIHRIRTAARPKVTQAMLVRRLAELGIVLTQSQIAKIEHGERLVADFELVGFASALGVPIQEFFPVDPSPTDHGHAQEKPQA